MSGEEFVREIRCRKGYDRRDEPGGGAHGMELHFILRGERGAILGVVNTGWMSQPLTYGMRHDGQPQDRRRKPGVDGRLADHFPSGGGVSSHVPTQDNEWWVGPNSCTILPGGTCYGDIGYTVGGDFLAALVAGGDEAAWEFLVEVYHDWLVVDEVTA